MTDTPMIPIGTRVRNQDLPPGHPSGKTGTMTGTVVGHDGIFHTVAADDGQVWDSELAGDLTVEHPASCYPCKGTGRVVGFGAANGGPCPADHITEG